MSRMTKEEIEQKEKEDEQRMLDEVVGKTATKVAETVTPAITEDVLKAVTEKIALRKSEIFGGGDNAELKGIEAKRKSAEYMKEWYKKALVSGGSTGGGEDLVPTYLADQFIGVAQNYGLVRRRARHWPMEGMKQSIPTLDTVSAYRIDTDGNKITTSQPTTGVLNLNSKTVGIIVPVSRKLLANSSIQLVDALSYLAGKALAKLEDKWGLLGLSGTEGILGNTSVPVTTLGSATTYAGATAEDLLSLTEGVDESFFETANNMSFVMSLGVLNNFRKIRSVVGSDKQGFLFESFSNPQVPSSMWGIPYDLSPIMPNNSVGSQAATKFLALVNWDNVIFGDDRQYTMEVSNQATITDTDGSTLINLFEQNMVAIKITGDIDIEIANAAKAHAVLKTHA